MTIHIVLDASAIVLYSQLELRSLAVGELIRVVEENDGQIGIPALAFVEAYRECGSASAQQSIERLVNRLPGTAVLLPLQNQDVLDVAGRWATLTVSQSHVLVEGLRHAASIVTCEAAKFAEHIDEAELLPV